MTTIDIRTLNTSSVVDILFAEKGQAVEGSRTDIAYKLNQNPLKENTPFVFLEALNSEYITLRRSDVPNLIKALQKAQELWDGCK